MYDNIPDSIDPREALEAAREEGWVPVVAILSQRTEVDGQPGVDIKHLHYLWGLDEETAIKVALSFIAEMHIVMTERQAQRAREN